MRYVTASHISPGMLLATPIYGANFSVLLGDGVTLSASHIRRINELGYAGIYIWDELSRDIKSTDIIDMELRIQTAKYAKEIIQQAEAQGVQGGSVKITRVKQDRIIMPVMEALISAPRRLVDMIDLKPYDDYVYYHSASAVILSLLLGIELGLSGTQLYELGLSSLLHDIGNIFVPKDVLNKPGKLTDKEFDIIKQHTQTGFDYLRDNFDISIEGCMGALQHHENYDGTGYPNQLKKDKISIYGRIISITDVYDALISRRPYRRPMFPPAAMAFIDMNSGTMFDPEIVKAFQRVISLYPTGICVETNTGEKCIVVENYAGSTSRPRLRLITTTPVDPIYLDLHADSALLDTEVSHIIEI